MGRGWWEAEATCREADPEIFFELEDAVDDDRVADPMLVSAALSYCKTCPIKKRCREEAKATKAFGIWGATTAQDRGLKYRKPRVREDA